MIGKSETQLNGKNYKNNYSQWQCLQRVIWEELTDIAHILNLVGSIPSLN